MIILEYQMKFNVYINQMFRGNLDTFRFFQSSKKIPFKISATYFYNRQQSNVIDVIFSIEIMHAEVNTDVAWLIDRNVEATTGVHFNRGDRGDDLNDDWHKINQRSNDFHGNYSHPRETR